MKKIMFSDKFGLTQAVLDGRKTMTRRIVSEKLWDKWTEYDNLCCAVGVGGLAELGVDVTREYSKCEKFFLGNSPYKVGEVVAIAQSYKDAGVIHIPCEDEEFGCYDFPAEQTNGWSNKMFVRADLMPHQIRITNIRIERLQDISYDDILAEGISTFIDAFTNARYFTFKNAPKDYFSHRTAFRTLIDKVSGKSTWGSNPYVFAYEFKLVK